MRKACSLSFILALVGCAVHIFLPAARACSRFSPVSIDEMFFEADAIIRVSAVKYVVAPKDGFYTTGTPDSTVEFKVEEVLRGKEFPTTLVFNGYLSDRDDFNDRPVPYDFVRRLGRRGSCYANEYKRGAHFLLFLKKGETGFTPYWNALAPTNEQLKSADEPWMVWAREYIRSAAERPSPEMELRRLTRMWDDAMMKRDAETLDRLLADDYSVSFYSKAMYIAAVTSPNSKFTVARKEGVRVRFYGDTAIVTGHNRIKSEGKESGQSSSSFNFMDVWVKQHGHWRCVATMGEQ